MIRRPPRPTLFPYTPLSRPRPGLALLALLAGAAVPAAAQAPTLTITLQSETPRIQTTQLLADGKFTALMRSGRSEEHTSELQSQSNLVCRLLLAKTTTHGCA